MLFLRPFLNSVLSLKLPSKNGVAIEDYSSRTMERIHVISKLCHGHSEIQFIKKRHVRKLLKFDGKSNWLGLYINYKYLRIRVLILRTDLS